MKKSRLIALLSALMVVAAMAFVVGCGSDDDNGDSGSTATGSDLGSELITEGTLTVGSDIPYRPFEFGNPPDYKGFDIDIVNAVADRLGLEVVIRDTAFETIFTDVAQGKFDLVASASTITPDRQKQVNFSDPYFETPQALLVPEGSDIASVEDLAGLTIGAQDGTTGEQFANDETDAGDVRPYPGGPQTIAALQNGQVEAVIIDLEVAQDALGEGQAGFEIATEVPTGELYGLAMSKNSPALLEAVNGALTEMKEDGTLNEIYRTWFKKDAPEAVLSGTTNNEGDADSGDGGETDTE